MTGAQKQMWNQLHLVYRCVSQLMKVVAMIIQYPFRTQLHHQARFSYGCVRSGNGLQPTDRAILQQDAPWWHVRPLFQKTTGEATVISCRWRLIGLNKWLFFMDPGLPFIWLQAKWNAFVHVYWDWILVDSENQKKLSSITQFHPGFEPRSFRTSS